MRLVLGGRNWDIKIKADFNNPEFRTAKRGLGSTKQLAAEGVQGGSGTRVSVGGVKWSKTCL